MISKINDEAIDIASTMVMLVPGVTRANDSWLLTDWDNGDDEIYTKFMSDRGVTDDANGEAFHKFLDNMGVRHDHQRARSNQLKVADFLHALGVI